MGKNTCPFSVHVRRSLSVNVNAQTHLSGISRNIATTTSGTKAIFMRDVPIHLLSHQNSSTSNGYLLPGRKKMCEVTNSRCFRPFKRALAKWRSQSANGMRSVVQTKETREEKKWWKKLFVSWQPTDSLFLCRAHEPKNKQKCAKIPKYLYIVKENGATPVVVVVGADAAVAAGDVIRVSPPDFFYFHLSSSVGGNNIIKYSHSISRYLFVCMCLCARTKEMEILAV